MSAALIRLIVLVVLAGMAVAAALSGKDPEGMA